MQVTDEVVWDVRDFVVFAALLLGVGVAYELAARRTNRRAYRLAVGLALAAAFLTVWINLAVGIIGDEENPANLMYTGVLAVGVIGALVARMRPRGMARALFATALAQVSVAVVALIGGFGSTGPTWPLDTLVLTAFFAALWVLSARLFRIAAQERPPAGAVSDSS